MGFGNSYLPSRPAARGSKRGNSTMNYPTATANVNDGTYMHYPRGTNALSGGTTGGYRPPQGGGSIPAQHPVTPPPQIPQTPINQGLPDWWNQMMAQQSTQVPQMAQNPYMNQLGALAGKYGSLNPNAPLSADIMNQLAAIKAQETGAVNSSYTQNKNTLLEDLFGRGLAQSSYGSNQGARLGQYLGDSMAKVESDAAQRQLAQQQQAYQNQLAALSGQGQTLGQAAGLDQNSILAQFGAQQKAQSDQLGIQQFSQQQAAQQRQQELDNQWRQYQAQQGQYGQDQAGVQAEQQRQFDAAQREKDRQLQLQLAQLAGGTGAAQAAPQYTQSQQPQQSGPKAYQMARTGAGSFGTFGGFGQLIPGLSQLVNNTNAGYGGFGQMGGAGLGNVVAPQNQQFAPMQQQQQGVGGQQMDLASILRSLQPQPAQQSNVWTAADWANFDKQMGNG